MHTAEEAKEWLNTYHHPNQLAHFGVLGMKWGVRKDRSTNNIKSVNSKEDTKLSRGQKILIGAGIGVVVAALAGGVAYHYRDQLRAIPHINRIRSELKQNESLSSSLQRGKDFIDDHVDTSVPINTLFSRVAGVKETSVGTGKYATYIPEDVLNYRESWEAYRNKKAFVTQFTAKKDVKIASPKSIFKTLHDSIDTPLADGYSLRDNYSIFKKTDFASHPTNDLVNEILRSNTATSWRGIVGEASSANIKKAGYSAITDVLDTSGKTAKHSVILLDNNAFDVSSRILSKSERIAAGYLAKQR